MGKYLVPAVLAAIFAATGLAWAVVLTSSLKITDSGKPLPGATISLTKTPSELPVTHERVHHEPPKPHKLAKPVHPTEKRIVESRPKKPREHKLVWRPHPVEKRIVQFRRHPHEKFVQRRRTGVIVAKGKTDERGFVVLQFDDGQVRRDDLVDVSIKTEDGRERRWSSVSLGALLAAGQIDFTDGLVVAPISGIATSSPQIAMIVEPRISGGLGGSASSVNYASTGPQFPYAADASPTMGQLCGGVGIFPSAGIRPVRLGVDVNVCSGSNTFGSGDTLFAIMRHGPGQVDLRQSTNVLVDLLLMGAVPVMRLGPSNDLLLSSGVGVSMRTLGLTMTSNQSFFGGGVPMTTQSFGQSGFAFSAGLSTFACTDCIAGNPLKVGVEGRARFFPSQSVGLPSPVFGFVETASVGQSTDYSVMFTLAVPLAVPAP